MWGPSSSSSSSSRRRERYVSHPPTHLPPSHPPTHPPTRAQIEKRQNLIAFWLLGLVNNSVYVIMIAGATGRWVGGWVGLDECMYAGPFPL